VIPSAIERYFAGLSRNTFLLALTSLFADISTEMLYPVLPVFLTDTLKASGSIVGLVDGAAQAAQNMVQGFSGALSDKLQRRKPIALAGYLLAALAKPLTGLATIWEGVLGARLLDRIGAGIRTAPRDALVAASVAEADRGRAFGLEGFGDNAGAFLGPLVAVALLYKIGLGLRAVFYLTVVPGLLAFLMVLLIREQKAAVAAATKIDVSPRQLPRGYWIYLGVTAAFRAGRLQPRRRADFLSGRIAFRPLGPEKSSARRLCDLLRGLSRLCARPRRKPRRGLIRFLRPVSGDLPRGREVVRIGFRAGIAARQRHRVVQRHRWPAAARGEPRRRGAVGSRRPCGGVLLRRCLCRPRQRSAPDDDAGERIGGRVTASRSEVGRRRGGELTEIGHAERVLDVADARQASIVLRDQDLDVAGDGTPGPLQGGEHQSLFQAPLMIVLAEAAKQHGCRVEGVRGHARGVAAQSDGTFCVDKEAAPEHAVFPHQVLVRRDFFRLARARGCALLIASREQQTRAHGAGGEMVVRRVRLEVDVMPARS
jgi:Major Facilitator Superfamily